LFLLIDIPCFID